MEKGIQKSDKRNNKSKKDKLPLSIARESNSFNKSELSVWKDLINQGKRMFPDFEVRDDSRLVFKYIKNRLPANWTRNHVIIEHYYIQKFYHGNYHQDMEQFLRNVAKCYNEKYELVWYDIWYSVSRTCTPILKLHYLAKLMNL